MRYTVCLECISQALSYGREGRSPKTPREIIHTDLERRFLADITGIKYFQVFVGEATRDKRVPGLKTRDVSNSSTADYIDRMTRVGMTIKCISEDGAGDVGRSVKAQAMVVDRGIR